MRPLFLGPLTHSFLLQTSYSNHHENDDKTPIWIHLSVDLRPMHIFTVSSSSGSDALSPLTDPYIHNASSTIPLLPPPLASELQSTSLGALALRIRRAITAYIAHPALIERELAWLNHNPRIELFRGEEHETQTDWAAARFSELDFSGARALESECKGSGRVLFVLPKTVLEPYMPLWGHGAILMEDENAFWMSQVKGREEWEEIRSGGQGGRVVLD